MKRVVAAFLVTGAAFLAFGATTAAAAQYKVTTKAGRAVGQVAPGPLPSAADRIGVVRDVTGFRGAVYSRQTSSGRTGWPVSDGSSYVAWVQKAGTQRFLVKKVPWTSAVWRVTLNGSGRWTAQKRSDGRWVTVGRVQKGCRGAWAAGASWLLLGSR